MSKTKNSMMISTPLRSKILRHTRSSSLPSRSHPLIPQFNGHLQTLHLHSDSSSFLSISKNLTTLDHLYNCLDDLLLLHHTRQLFSRVSKSNHKWVHQVLDGYLALVDACATAKDFLSHAKEHLLHLHSLLRRSRRDSDHLCASRKTAKKMIHKTLRHITALKHKPSVLALDKDAETIAVISMLKETEAATLDLIESLLWSVSGSKRLGGWSLVSRLISSRRQDDDDEKHTLEFSEVDAMIEKVVRIDGGVQVDEVRVQLREMEESLRVVEDKLEGLFKRLVRTRVSLLNMHSN